jgi:hypothetical protein
METFCEDRTGLGSYPMAGCFISCVNPYHFIVRAELVMPQGRTVKLFLVKIHTKIWNIYGDSDTEKKSLPILRNFDFTWKILFSNVIIKFKYF